MLSLALIIGVKLVGLTIFLIVRAAQQSSQPPRPMLGPGGPYPGQQPYNPYAPPGPYPQQGFQPPYHPQQPYPGQGYGAPPQYTPGGYNAPGHPFGNAPNYGAPAQPGPGGDWPPPGGPQR